jgi:hypothetical protein
VGLYPGGPGGLGDFPAGLYPVLRLALQELLIRQRNDSRQPRRTDFRFTAVPIAGVIFAGQRKAVAVRRQILAGTWTAPACAVSGGRVSAAC